MRADVREIPLRKFNSYHEEFVCFELEHTTISFVVVPCRELL